MKMKPEHYAEIKAMLQSFLDNCGDVLQVREYQTRVSPMKFRWDLFRFAGGTAYTCGTLYDYLDDSHIDTALKQAVKELLP